MPETRPGWEVNGAKDVKEANEAMGPEPIRSATDGHAAQ
jgi:hypothetical protein